MKETILNITITMSIRLPLPPTSAATAMQPEERERPVCRCGGHHEQHKTA